METGFLSSFLSEGARFGYTRGARSKVLLREPERCMECNRVFVSLYALKSCKDHEGLDEI